MLNKVSNYNENVPKGAFGFAGFRWGFLFVLDFFFEFSQRNKQDGKVMKKLENPSAIGRRFRSEHQRCVNRLIKKNQNDFRQTFDIPSIEAEDFDQEFFINWRKRINMPIVIKGYLKDAPILKEASKEHLINDHGGKEVQCVAVENKEGNRVGQNISADKTTLADFLTLPEYESHYINNFYGIFDEEDFKKKCKGEELDAIQGQTNMVTHWFISRSNSVGSSLHCAGGENMFLNIVGRKQWDFIHPSYNSVVQPSVSKYAAYAVSEMTEKFVDDPHKELLDGYPYMRHVPFYRCELEEGDMLYNPDFWWHSVRNLTDFNVACATRYWASSINVSALSISMILDMIKNPKKSSTVQAIKILKGKQSKSVFNDIIFTSKKKLEKRT